MYSLMYVSLQMSNFGPIKMPVGAAYLRSQIMTSSRQSSTRADFAFRANTKSPLMDVKPYLVISQKMPIFASKWQDNVQSCITFSKYSLVSIILKILNTAAKVINRYVETSRCNGDIPPILCFRLHLGKDNTAKGRQGSTPYLPNLHHIILINI